MAAGEKPASTACVNVKRLYWPAATRRMAASGVSLQRCFRSAKVTLQ
jgi:hypothetical protein